MDKKDTNPYIMPPEKANILEEPFVMYGTLDLDESKRYNLKVSTILELLTNAIKKRLFIYSKDWKLI